MIAAVSDRKSTQSRARELRKRMTAAEVAFWQHVRRGRLGVRFQRQVPIGPFIVDFVCRSRRVIVELDGAVHLDPWDQYDLERDAYLQSRGYRVLRFENDELADNPDGVLEVVRRALRKPAS